MSHPNFNKGVSKRALPVAVNKLTLKAWDAYIAARGLAVKDEPQFIRMIRERRRSVRINKANGPVSGDASEETSATAWDSEETFD